MEFDCQLATLGYEAHLIDERTKSLSSFGTQLQPVKLFVRALDSLAVEIRKLRMQPRRRRLCVLHFRHELLFAHFEREELFLHARRAQTVLNRVDNGADLPLDAVELFLAANVVFVTCCIQPIEFAVIFGGKLLREFGSHQVHLQSRQNACLEDVAPDRQKVVASATIARVRAAVMGAG